MNRYALVFFLLLISTFSSNAQLRAGSPDDIKIVRKLPLIVVLQDEDPAVIKRLTKKNPEKLDNYRATLASNNAILQKYISRYWKFSPEVQFKFASEINPLLENPTQIYSTLRISAFIVTQFQYGSKSGPTQNLNQYAGLFLHLAGKGQSPSRNVCIEQLNGDSVSSSDIIFAIRRIQQTIEKPAEERKSHSMSKEAEVNGPKLKEKTLLINEKYLPDNMSIDDLQKIYPFPLQIADREIIDKAIDEEDPRYACVWPMPISEKKPGLIVISTDKIEVLAYSRANFLTTAVDHNSGDNKPRIHKSTLKDFIEHATDK
jgi:hypothetical protein